MNNLIAKAKKNNKGFTLVELIIVVVIIAILAAVLAPMYIQYVERSREANDKNAIVSVENAIMTLLVDGTAANDDTFVIDADGDVTATDDSVPTGAANTVLQDALEDIIGSENLTLTSDVAEKACDIKFTVVSDTELTMEFADDTEGDFDEWGMN